MVRFGITRHKGMFIGPECRWWTEHVDVWWVKARVRSESGHVVSSRRESWRGTHGHMVRLVSDAPASLARLGSSSGLGLILMGIYTNSRTVNTIRQMYLILHYEINSSLIFQFRFTLTNKSLTTAFKGIRCI